VLQGGFRGMTSSNSDGDGGSNMRKKGKTGNPDEVNIIIASFYAIKLILCFTSNKGVRRLRS